VSAPWVAAFIALWIVVLLMAGVVLGVLRRMTTVLVQVERGAASGAGAAAIGGIPVDSHANAFRAALEIGDDVASNDLVREPMILLFMGGYCGPCEEIAPELADVGDTIEGLPFVVVLNEEEGRPPWLPLSVPVVYQRGGEVARAFENIATPQAYVVEPNLLVRAKRLVGSVGDLRELALSGVAKGGDAGVDHAQVEVVQR
jgi:thiol-disulfide isomerase/thioredoxin